MSGIVQAIDRLHHDIACIHDTICTIICYSPRPLPLPARLGTSMCVANEYTKNTPVIIFCRFDPFLNLSMACLSAMQQRGLGRQRPQIFNVFPLALANASSDALLAE